MVLHNIILKKIQFGKLFKTWAVFLMETVDIAFRNIQTFDSKIEEKINQIINDNIC